MAKYYRQQGEAKRRKILRHIRPIVLLVFLGIFGLCCWLVYDVFRQKGAADTASTPSKAVSSTIVASTEVQTTPYFQFQAPLKWKSISNESREGHYVYRQFNGPLIEQELVVDVNNPVQEVIANTLNTRVIPVEVTGGGALKPVNTEIAHCKKAAKPGTEKTNQMITLDKVTFPCNPDNTSYKVVVGLVGGSNIMRLPRPGGGTAPYKIMYQNVTANPSARDILSILRTFETR